MREQVLGVGGGEGVEGGCWKSPERAPPHWNESKGKESVNY